MDQRGQKDFPVSLRRDHVTTIVTAGCLIPLWRKAKLVNSNWRDLVAVKADRVAAVDGAARAVLRGSYGDHPPPLP